MNNQQLGTWHPWWFVEGNHWPSLARWLLLKDVPSFLRIQRVVHWSELAVLFQSSFTGMSGSRGYQQSSRCLQGLGVCCSPLHVCWPQEHCRAGDGDIMYLPLWIQLQGYWFMSSLGWNPSVRRSEPSESRSCAPSWMNWKLHCPYNHLYVSQGWLRALVFSLGNCSWG